MSHSKDDIDETTADESGLMLVDLLYGDMSDDERERATASLLEKDPSLEEDLEALTSVRALLRHLPEEEPPASITAKLMHAAALHAPAQPEKQNAGDKPGILAFFASLFRPIAMHPGLAAAASMVLIVLVGGTLYMSGKSDGLGEPEVIDQPAVAQPEGRLADRAISETAALESDDTGSAFDTGDAPDTDDTDETQMALVGDELDGKLDKNALGRGAALDGLMDEKKASSSSKRSRKSSSRIGKYYEGEPLDADGYRSGARGNATTSGRAIGGAGSPGGTSAPVIAKGTTRSAPMEERQAAEEGAEAEASVPDHVRADDDRDAEDAPAPEPAPRPAPAPAAEKPSASKSPTQTKRPAKKKSRSPARDDNDERSRIESLHSEARAAAARGDCKTVAEAGRMIESRDARYYNDTFRKDRALSKCFTQKAP